MNTEIQQKEPTKTLPQLMKQSATYKLIVPREVEEKIRYLCRKFPTLEWSGVLFTTHSGTFEDGNLVITCKDLFPMDLGSATFTEFKMSPEVAGYMAQNIELFDCDLQIIHSHNQMSCFFSGTDLNTLREEGNDRNCFVSLIVNNAGTYCAAITRKIQTKHEVTIKKLGSSYEFFGNGSITTEEEPMSETTQIVDKEIIEYFMLDVEREEVTNPLGYLDERFKEIEEKKRTERASIPAASSYTLFDSVSQKDSIRPDESFREYLNRKEKTKSEPVLQFEDADALQSWVPDYDIIHDSLVHIILCSLTVNTEKLDLKQWIVKYMVKKYDEMFIGIDEFNLWAEFIIDFYVSRYSDPNTPPEAYDNWEVFQSSVAEAMIDQLGEFESNKYIDKYIEILNRYI